jgi:hypothetical protein
MRWRRAAIGVFAIVTMTGCPSEFGKEGRVSKAVRQDALELSKKHCSAADLKRFCDGGRERTQECIDKCGG